MASITAQEGSSTSGRNCQTEKKAMSRAHPVIVKLPSADRRAQVRPKGKQISNTFWRMSDADEWALASERTIDRRLDPREV